MNKKYKVEIYQKIDGQRRIESSAKEQSDKDLIEILADLGESIDPHGYGGGDYDRAIKAIKSWVRKYSKQT